MKCCHCDSPISDTARFCENCGYVVRGDDSTGQLLTAYRKEMEGRIEEAVVEYERLLTADEGPTRSAMVAKHLGNLHFRLGHLRRARSHLTRACDLEPGNAVFWHDLGVVAYHMADFDAALDALSRALKLDPRGHLAHFWQGNAYYHRGEHAQAAEAFEKLLRSYPNFTIARFHLGVIYARQGDKARAEKEFRKVLLENPEDAAARFYVSG